LLSESREHPTAGHTHEALRREFPRVSLGTVYRNLEILASEGRIEAVPTPYGPTRYDGNVSPHHHFICEGCGEIEDIELRLPDELTARVRRKYRLRPTRLRIDFYGLCRSCAGRSSP
jgi:Fe2+ or Zn2+ uptake regulation protein